MTLLLPMSALVLGMMTLGAPEDFVRTELTRADYTAVALMRRLGMRVNDLRTLAFSLMILCNS